METYQFLLTAVSTVGFPIVMSAVIFWYLNEERKSHTEEIDRLRSTLEENTQAIIKLRDFLELAGGDKWKS